MQKCDESIIHHAIGVSLPVLCADAKPLTVGDLQETLHAQPLLIQNATPEDISDQGGCLNPWIYDPCMEYLPTFTPKMAQM